MGIKFIDLKTQNWCGYNIRFVKYCGTWYAVLKDICDALDLNTYNIAYRIDANNIRKLSIPSCKREAIAQPMLVVNERGIYQVLLFKDRRPEVRELIDWMCDMLERMRTAIGLRPYEVMRMTEPEIRRRIDEQLDDVLVYNKE
jgi:prophage antirepressor-like protein